VAPATPADAKGLLKTCIRDDNPILFIEHKMLYGIKGEIPDGEHLVPLGKAAIRQEGSDLTIISYSRMANTCAEVGKKLAADGISAEVIDLRSLKPLDTRTILESVRKTGRVLLVSEACSNTNFVCEIAMRINEHAFDYLDAPIVRVCAADVPVPMSPTLEDAAIPNPDRIMEAARKLAKGEV